MKFLDLGLSDPALRPALDAAYRRVMDSGWVVLGPEVAAFEGEFAAYCGAAHAVGVGNGLDALTLSLRAADIGAGAEVIVPSHTYAATWIGVTAAGARPVPVEVDPHTCAIDPAAAAAAITERTAAILPVSLYGHPADMDALMALAQRHGLFVLEDAAQSHGATYRGRKVGSLAHATAFSFYPTKNLGAIGDGGAVVTNDAALAARLRRLRNYGQERKYIHDELGVNSRLDELQAAFLRVQLDRLDEGNAARSRVAQLYSEALAGCPGVRTPVEAAWARHVYHLYVVRAADRDRLQADLKTRDIETLVHYPVPCHLQPAFAYLGLGEGAFPIAERLAAEVLSLPLRPTMQSADVAAVAAAVRDSAAASKVADA
jgi:dTDP-3-amino-3,4,6-trideoxy-alpha-D-glucose transaminase